MMEATNIGMNKTGLDMKPFESKKALKNALNYSPDFTSRTDLIKDIRAEMIEEAEPVGTVPIPGKMKGVINMGAQAIKGMNASLFIDKMAERLAFERSGVRLYEALIGKCEAVGLKDVPFSIETLKEYQQEEAQHFLMLKECLEQLGADPTCMTPSADVSAVAASGHLQVMTDPRTTVADCVQSLLALELLDNEAWKLLIELAENMGESEMAQRFDQASQEEEKHLAGVRDLYRLLLKSDESLSLDHIM